MEKVYDSENRIHGYVDDGGVIYNHNYQISGYTDGSTLYDRNRTPLGYLDNRFVHTMDGTPVGYYNNYSLYDMRGNYLGYGNFGFGGLLGASLLFLLFSPIFWRRPVFW